MTRPSVHQSLPNIFEDLGLPDAKVHFLKAQIVAELYRLASEGELDDAKVADRLGIDDQEVKRLFRGDFRDLAVERLMGFLTAFDQDVEIVARPRASGSTSGGTVTFRAA